MSDVKWYITEGIDEQKVRKGIDDDRASGKSVDLHYHRESEPCNEKCEVPAQ